MARRRPSEPTANPARGAALVVVAVVIGLFLLREGLDSSEAVTADPSDQGSDSSDSGDGSDGSDEGGDGTTTTTVATRPPGEVPTIVLNDSGIAGAAGTYSDALLAVGYQLTNPDGANADAEGNAATTLVHFAPGFEAEAAAVAAAIGAPDLVPSALPTTPPGPIAGASVVVVLGTDLAGVTPTTAAPADTTTTTAAE
jgi:LytR cell envelope-related transcriptional attenuator